MSLLDRIRDTVSQETDNPATTSINPEDGYRVLSNERRRRVVGFLAESEVGDDVPVGTQQTGCRTALTGLRVTLLSLRVISVF